MGANKGKQDHLVGGPVREDELGSSAPAWQKVDHQRKGSLEVPKGRHERLDIERGVTELQS